jgi:signal transduction histidine kinase
MVISAPDEVLTIVRNITERKQARQREFELALEKERVNLLRQFIEKASHEFRTPLSIITTSAFLGARTEDAENRQRRAESIHEQVLRMTRLVDMLLRMAHLESGAKPSFSRVNVGLILSAVCQNMIEFYGDNPKLHYECQQDLPSVRGSFDDLVEAFAQVLDNAYRFTPADGIVTITAGAGDGSIWIEVCDTGSGIKDEDRLHIFETFWRLDDAHTTPGFGLGLPITQKIVELHGGSISVHSDPAKKTCFRIVLPLDGESLS